MAKILLPLVKPADIQNEDHYVLGGIYMGLFSSKKSEFEATIEKDIHLLVLDQKWHELFDNGKKPMRIQSVENKVNNLLKEQGKVNNDLKDYAFLKKKVMSDIVADMELLGDNDMDASKRMEKNKRYVEEINHKIEKMTKRADELPDLLYTRNKELVKLTMDYFYLDMVDKKNKADELKEEIEILKRRIQETIVQKDALGEEYQSLYKYIHDVVGSDVMGQYDAYYMSSSVTDMIEDELKEKALREEQDVAEEQEKQETIYVLKDAGSKSKEE